MSGNSGTRFEAAVNAVVAGDLDILRSLLHDDPDLVHARSTRPHHATLLHYIAANGVEDDRQQTPPDIVAIAELLLQSGADVDATADMFGGQYTTMRLLVSSAHPARAGVQGALAELLLDHGASLTAYASTWQSPLMTALIFGYLPTAELLVKRGAPLDDIAAFAGLGRREETARLLPAADPHSRHAALALAAQSGHADIVELLLDAGEDPDRYNPPGMHAHATPLHRAVSADRLNVVTLLATRGARLDIRDTIFGGTPLGWALHEQRTTIAAYLRSVGAPAA